MSRTTETIRQDRVHQIAALPLKDLRRLAKARAAAQPGSRRTTGPFAPILRLTRDQVGPAMFCIHPAIGLCWRYSRLAGHLPSWSIYGLQAPTLTEPNLVFGALDDLAAEYAKRIQTIQPHGPYHLLGWSFGGNAAHQIACHLQNLGEAVETLCLLDPSPFGAAALHEPPPRTEGEFMRLVLQDLDVTLPPEACGGRLSFATGLNLLLAKNFLPAGTTLQTLELLAKVHADILEMKAKGGQGVFRGDMLYIAATLDGEDPKRKAAAWQPHVKGVVFLEQVASTHTRMLDPQNLPEIGRVVGGYVGVQRTAESR